MNPRARKFLVALVSVLLTILVTHEDVLHLGIVERLELATLDLRFSLRGTHPAVPDSSHVVIVEISDESYRSLSSRWPWPRSYYAHLVRNLKEAGARVVGIDVILDGPDPYSPANDDDLRAAIRETGIVVLAGKLPPPEKKFDLRRGDENFGNHFFPVDSALGLVNIVNDADGVHRRYSPFWEIRFPGEDGRMDIQRIPTFAFAVLNTYFRLPPLATAGNLSDAFLYAGQRIPKYDAASILINLYGPSRSFTHINFVDVIDDETITTTEEAATGQETNTFTGDDAFRATFRDRIVLVGSTKPEDKDLFPVALKEKGLQTTNMMYGVEIHANIIESVLRGEYLRRLPMVVEFLFIALFTFVTFYATSALRSSRNLRHFVLESVGVLILVVEALVVAIVVVVLFSRFSIVMPAISPLSGIVVAYFASTAYYYVTERKQRLLIKTMFSTYVNPRVVDELIAHPEKLKLGGERKELTVLFCDLKDFTTLSEKLPSEHLVSLLNEYFSEMSDIVLRNEGTLDKFFGDAIVAFWGAPLPQDDHALRACMSALDMQQRLAAIRQQWKNEGKPELYARIGINTGEMVVGNMGGTGKYDYTVIGDGVNIASRLEGANKVYRTGIMVSESTYSLVKHRIVGRELDLIAVKGRSEPLRTYELLQRYDGTLDPSLEQFLELYSAGLHYYRSRRWNEACEKFRAALALRPNDYPTHLHLERAESFRLNPPPPEWNGVVELMIK
jgi:adenylate cyclase